MNGKQNFGIASMVTVLLSLKICRVVFYTRGSALQYVVGMAIYLCLIIDGTAQLQWMETESKFNGSDTAPSVAHEFRCKNVGVNTVKIVSLKVSCPACTRATASSLSINPGKSESVTVTMDRRGRRGSQLESVVVKTDGGDEMRLTMHVFTTTALGISPPFLWWKHDEKLAAKEFYVEVKDASLGVKGIKVSAEPANCDIEVITEAGGEHYRVRITPKDTTHAGVTSIKFQADIPGIEFASVLGYAKIL